nr:hypothetical protein [uncultured Duganella sp.]
MTNLTKVATAAAALARDLTEASHASEALRCAAILQMHAADGLGLVRLHCGALVDEALYQRVKEDLLDDFESTPICMPTPANYLCRIALWDSLSGHERHLAKKCIAHLVFDKTLDLVDITLEGERQRWYCRPYPCRIPSWQRAHDHDYKSGPLASHPTT